MSFSEQIKDNVRRKANFTCCFCMKNTNRVEVHHIIPEAEGGPDNEENAAPLCPNCHDIFGGNLNYRTEIIRRRDHWYSICDRIINPQFGWPIGLDVPLLSFVNEIPPDNYHPLRGIQLTDRDPLDHANPPLLLITFFFKQSRFFGHNLPDLNEKWLYVNANMRFAFNLRIQVCVSNDRDISSLMAFLSRGDKKYIPEFLLVTRGELQDQYIASRENGWALFGPSPESDSSRGDYLRVWRENEENRLLISTFTPTNAGISVSARFTDDVSIEIAHYLEGVGFTENSNT